MSYKNVKAHALGHLRDLMVATLDQLLCNMSCIVNDNHKKKINYTIQVPKI